MYDKYPNYKALDKMVGVDNHPEYLIIHCSDSDIDNFDIIQRYHITDPSRRYENVSYQYIIERSGLLKSGRPETYHGGHTAEQGMNKKSIGICLCGKFENKLPSKEQTETLKILLTRLTIKYGITSDKIKYHRHFKPSKTCPGMAIKDDWAKNILIQDVVNWEEEYKTLKAKLDAIKDIVKM